METSHQGEKVTVTKICQWCYREASLTVDRDGYNAWMAGELIQNAFPDVPKEEREILISGTHPACWTAMWAGSEDE